MLVIEKHRLGSSFVAKRANTRAAKDPLNGTLVREYADIHAALAQ